jgi:hypothetical protein
VCRREVSVCVETVAHAEGAQPSPARGCHLSRSRPIRSQNLSRRALMDSIKIEVQSHTPPPNLMIYGARYPQTSSKISLSSSLLLVFVLQIPNVAIYGEIVFQ